MLSSKKRARKLLYATIEIRALRNIEKGEELCPSYGSGYKNLMISLVARVAKYFYDFEKHSSVIYNTR